MVRSSLVSSDSLVMSYTQTLNNINTDKLEDSNLGMATSYFKSLTEIAIHHIEKFE